MPQHRDFRLPHHAHGCPIRTRGNHSGSRYNPHSRAVVLAHDRIFREQVEETRKHQDSSSPTTTPALAAVDRQTPPAPGVSALPRPRGGRFVTHTQLTA